jgi:hypothetical protein
MPHKNLMARAECGQLLLQLTNVVPAKREVMNEIARAFFVQPALSKLPFELAFQTEQIGVDRLELRP